VKTKPETSIFSSFERWTYFYL